MTSRNPFSTSTPNSRPRSTDSASSSLLQTLVTHQLTQTQTLGEIKGEIGGLKREVSRISRKVESIERPMLKTADFLTWLPGLLALAPWVLAALGKISWHDAVNSSTTGSGH